MFYIGVDLGQSNDPTAIAVVQQVGEQFRCGHLERVPLGTPYPLIVGRVAALMQHPTVAGNVRLAIDATGVGRPVCDMFERAGIRFVGVVITAGHEESNPGGNYRHVPKLSLISHVQALLHEGKLKIRQDLPEADNLVRELQDFRVNYSASGFMSFNAREGKHDDLVLSLSIAVWCALRQRTGQEAWDVFLEDWSRKGGAKVAPTPAPELGYSFATETMTTKLIVPPACVPGLAGVRFIGDAAYIEVTRDKAAGWLRNPVWRALNEELAEELLGKNA